MNYLKTERVQYQKSFSILRPSISNQRRKSNGNPRVTILVTLHEKIPRNRPRYRPVHGVYTGSSQSNRMES